MPRDVPSAPLMTGEQLRNLLREKKIVRGRRQLPLAGACEPLATILEALRWLASSVTPDNQARYQEVNQARRRFQAALDDLMAATPVLLRWHMPLAHPQLTGASAEIARARMALLLQLEETIPGIAKAFLEPDVPACIGWHDFAVGLAEAFRKAMHSTNPGVYFGRTPEGPVVRFLADFAIPHVTGEHPTKNAVARHLPRATAKGNKST